MGIPALRTTGGYLHYRWENDADPCRQNQDRRPAASPVRSRWPTVGSSLAEDQWDEATCLPGWSVRDVFSHVIGTESMLAGEPAPTADVSHLDHMKNAVAEGQ